MNTHINITRRKIIFGAGEMGKRAFEFYTKEDMDEVAFFADHFKGGTIHCGKQVLSLEDMLKIHHDYDIVIAIFDLFNAVASLVKNGIGSYVIWDDDDTKTGWDRFPNAHHVVKKMNIDFDNTDTRKKILYGAGAFGATMFRFFGKDRVYAFADSNLGGTRYFGKEVLHPESLVAMQDDYEILICIIAAVGVKDSLINIGVTKFNVFGNIFVDNMAVNLALVVDGSGYGFTPQCINEIKDVDFIKYPEMIREYKNIPIHMYRNFNRVRLNVNYISRTMLENYYYGFCAEFLAYAGCDNELYESPSVAHGIYDEDSVYELAIQFPNVLQPGINMRELTHNKYPNCMYFAIGHYLQYVRSFYDTYDYSVYKKGKGKNLICFPVHSTPDVGNSYDADDFVKFAFNEAKYFDSITLSAHYTDILSNSRTLQMFKAGGANIVCSGLMPDPSFCRRLKTVLETSDALLTNGYGSHIYYAAGLGKPLKIYRQDTIFEYRTNKQHVINKCKERQLSYISSERYELTKEQLEALNPVGGLDISYSKEEMAAIFELSKRIVKNAAYSYARYSESMRQTFEQLSESNKDKLMFSLMKNSLPANWQNSERRSFP